MKARASPETLPHPRPRLDSWGTAFFGAFFLALLGNTAQTASAQERETLLRLPPSGAAAMALSPAGKLLALVRDRYTLTLFDLQTKKELGSRGKLDEPITKAIFSPDGMTLATTSRRVSVGLWEAPSLKPKGHLGDKDFLVYDMAFSPDGKHLAATGGPKLTKVWDTQTGRELASWAGHRGSTECVTFSPDGRTLYTGGRDGAVKFWDIDKREQRDEHQLFDEPVLSLDASRDGKMLAVGSEHAIVLWDLGASKPHRRLKAWGRWVRFSPDGRALCHSTGRDVAVWQVATGKLRARLEGHKFGVYGLAFLKDGKTFLTVGGRTVKLWDMPNLDEDD